jgi:HAD superfamily hydrolase (TIGR01459 family)
MIIPQTISGLSTTLEGYDAYFLDQFGVLHNGRTPYSGVVNTLERLHEAGKKLIILTNSGKRAAPNFERLVEMGVPAHVISGVVSSGEVAWRGISAARFGKPFEAGRRVFVVGRSGDDYGLEGLGLDWAQQAEKADFLLILGSDAPRATLEDYAQLLEPAAKRKVPALCANPDIWMMSGGTLLFAPGAIATLYQKLGGEVSFIGKPYQVIYQQAFELCGGISKARILAVGDSVEHDIRGAFDFGIASALVRTGVLASKTADELSHLYALEQATPDYVLDEFKW